ncbi:hypothetical protein [Paenibacillus tundrae]|uniref:hypothetical protein n=1 Tax=Paenibacillus tundrae TaxID=528187 RepID=UPI0022A9E2CA|nr:hypothetical protein [Paenibacillus tundrae]
MLISSIGGRVAAANTFSVLSGSLHSGTILRISESIAKTYFVSKIVSKSESVKQNVNVDALKVNLEIETDIPQINKQIEIPFTQALDITNQEL